MSMSPLDLFLSHLKTHPPRAILFDMDGTLFESEELHQKSAETLLAELGHPRSLSQEWESFRGKTDQEVYTALIKELNLDITAVQFVQRKNQILCNLVESFSDQEFQKKIVIPDTHLVLKTYAGKIPLGLVTSSEKPVALCFLKKAKILDFFDVVITRRDVTFSKPHPEPYTLAVTKLNLLPQDCIALEDTLIGMSSALMANIQTFQVPNFLETKIPSN